MAEFFNITKQNISLHIKNIFEENELNESSVVKENLTTASDGKNIKKMEQKLIILCENKIRIGDEIYENIVYRKQ